MSCSLIYRKAGVVKIGVAQTGRGSHLSQNWEIAKSGAVEGSGLGPVHTKAHEQFIYFLLLFWGVKKGPGTHRIADADFLSAS